MKKIALTFTLSLTACFIFFAAHIFADEIEKPELKLISTDAFVTELLFALEADQYLIAVDVTSKLPKDYRPLPNIGYHRTLSAEGILNLQPTQVFGSEHIGPPAVLSALKEAYVPVLQLPSALNSEQLRSNIQTLATAVNREDKGRQVVAQMDHQLTLLNQQPLNNQRVAFLLSMDPSKLLMAGKDTSGDALIQLTHAQNVASFDNYRNIAAESLLALAPDIIIVAGRNPNNAIDELLSTNPILKHTPAGQHDNIIAINGSTLIAGLSPAAINEALKLVKRVNSLSPVTSSNAP